MVRVTFYLLNIYLAYTVLCFQAQATDLRSSKMMVLSPDIVQYIPNTSINMLVVNVNGLTSSITDDIEQGHLQLRIVEIISSKYLQIGQIINVPFQRAADEKARIMQGFNAWNSANIVQNRLLILGLKQGEEPGSWLAVTGDSIENMNAPLLVAVRQAFKIEFFRGSDSQKQQVLTKALSYEHPLLRFYAIKLLTERQLYSREIAFALFNSVLNIETINENIKLDLGRSLLNDSLLDTSLINDKTNSAIVSLLALNMLNVTDETLRTDWTSLLASAVLRSFDDDEIVDSAHRLSLVKTVMSPSSELIIKSLKRQIEGLPPEEVITQQELLAVWLKVNN